MQAAKEKLYYQVENKTNTISLLQTKGHMQCIKPATLRMVQSPKELFG